MYKILFFILVISFLYLLIKNQNDSIEHFLDGNFKLCEKNDCDCLKLNTAPDGTCVKYKISSITATNPKSFHVIIKKNI